MKVPSSFWRLLLLTVISSTLLHSHGFFYLHGTEPWLTSADTTQPERPLTRQTCTWAPAPLGVSEATVGRSLSSLSLTFFMSQCLPQKVIVKIKYDNIKACRQVVGTESNSSSINVFDKGTSLRAHLTSWLQFNVCIKQGGVGGRIKCWSLRYVKQTFKRIIYHLESLVTLWCKYVLAL